jgi:hypothetical protein
MLAPGMHAVDLPQPIVGVDIELGRRRHRAFTGPSGLLLFLCAFIPFTGDCSAASDPILWPPYAYGLVFALAASARTERGLRLAVAAMRVVTGLVFACGALLAYIFLPYAFLIFAPTSLVVCALGWTGKSERRAATAAIAVGGLGVVWFGLLSLAPGAPAGAYLSLVASVGLAVGGFVWLGDCAADLGYRYPHATLRVRRACSRSAHRL